MIILQRKHEICLHVDDDLLMVVMAICFFLYVCMMRIYLVRSCIIHHKICMQNNPNEFFTNHPPHPNAATTVNNSNKKNCSHKQKSKQQKILIQLPVSNSTKTRSFLSLSFCLSVCALHIFGMLLLLFCLSKSYV